MPYFHRKEPLPMNGEISIILPCYNGAGYLAERLGVLRDSLDELGAPWSTAEIFLVDDGSTDDSGAVAQGTWPNVQILTLPENSGKGAAVRAGMQQATGNYRFFLDADVPFDLSVLPRMLDYLDRKEFDLVIGARGIENARAHTRVGLWRGMASAIFTAFVSRIVVTGVHDTQCGIKGFRADVACYLFAQQQTRGFAFDVELLYLAYKNNLDIKRVPVTLLRGGSSTVSVLRHAPVMLRDVMKLPVRYYAGAYQMFMRETL